ncbi:15241_t:CDS:2, partial [Dentiscutata erythropus]
MWFDMPRNTTIEFEDIYEVSMRRCGNNDTLCKYNRRFDDLYLYLTSYLSQTKWFFKNKGVIFVDHHYSHTRDNVVKALNLDLNNESNSDNNELDIESVTNYDPEDMM